MALRASSHSLPLSDLIQSTANARRTVRVVAENRDGLGQLYIAKGEIVHAVYGDLLGNEAVHALLAADDLEYQVEVDVTTHTRSVVGSWQELIMDAARRQDEGSLTRPTNAPARLTDSSASSLAVRETEVVSETSIIGAVPDRPRRGGLALAVGLSAIGAGLLVWFLFEGELAGSNRPSLAVVHPASADPAIDAVDDQVYEASELTGDDHPPRLISGPPVLAPRRSSLDPNVVVRVQIDAAGQLAAHEIYRPRADLADFEAAALAAIASYQFAAAQRDGQAVAAWFNVAVTFEQPDPRGRRAIRVKGSDTIGGDLGPALADAFADPQVLVTIEALGSSTGFVGLLDGSAEIAASSRPPSPDELAAAEAGGIVLREFVIGYDGIAVIVHPDNPVADLDLVELAEVFTGTISNWKELGGADEDIELYSRPAASGTHGFFLGKVLRASDARADFALHTHYLDTSHDLSLAIAEHPAAIGYVGGAWAGDRVKVLAIDHVDTGQPVAPTPATISTGSYPIYRPLLFYTRKQMDRDTIGFLRFALGERGQAIVHEHGFVPAGIQPENAMPTLDGAAPDSGVRVIRLAFGSGVTELDDEQIVVLEDLVEPLGPDTRLVLIGTTETENERTAIARVRAVRGFLFEHGVGHGRIQIRASAVENHGSGGGSDRRRVDIYVIE